MPVKTRWIYSDSPNIPHAFRIAIGGNPVVAETLYRRGFQTIDAARAFLDPEAYQPSSPEELPDFHIACNLLRQSLENNARILVWGDFDVDGQTSTITLVEGLRELGGNILYHIPVRADESHGINKQVLEGYLKQGFDLLLTCDTGISEVDNIRTVRDAGIPVIVTDHHTLGETLPPANALVNPQRLPVTHPLRSLPGVGVAYKLIEGLFISLGRTFDSSKYLELVALGIVADVANLQGDTRYLLQKGLISLRRTSRVGLQTIYNNASLNPLHLNEGHIGYIIAPRLNAIGRLGDANPVVELLTTKDPGRARVLANEIEGMNLKRRFATRQVEKAAEAKLESSPEDRHAPAIILHHPNWPGGIVGIVAGRLAERYHKPAILLTGEDPIHGSARSIEGINITQVIATQSDLLNGYGGHPMAAGLSFAADKLTAVKRGILSSIKEKSKREEVISELQIDQILTLDEIKLPFIEEIERLSPFGSGNPPLHFMLKDLALISEVEIGEFGEHRQVTVVDENNNEQKIIWWNGGDMPLPEGQFDLVLSLSKSDYKGSPQINAEWIDYRLSTKGRLEVVKRHFSIIDHREALNPLKQLKTIINDYPGVVVWGEGNAPEDIDIRGRHELEETKTLIIWTAPPSQSVLKSVIRKTSPQTVILFGLNPNLDNLTGLMKRLTGIAKYAVKYKDGLASLEQISAACAAENATIKFGFKLLESMGTFKVEFSEDQVLIKLEPSRPGQSSIRVFQPIMIDLMKESRAYRRYFMSADVKSLFNNQLGGKSPFAS